MSTSPLSIDVYVAPMRTYACPDQLGEGEVATWAPSSSTLISGPTEGILIDALLTVESAEQIAAWAKSFGKKITGVYITHGHSDHWLGLARLREHFPEARGDAAPEGVGRAAWEAEFNKTSKYWTSRFPGELPETPVVREVGFSDEILVDGRVGNLIHVGPGDVGGSRLVHRPPAGPLCRGDRGSHHGSESTPSQRGGVTAAGWKNLPSWYIVSEQDNAIPPDAERFMAKGVEAVTESVNGGAL